MNTPKQAESKSKGKVIPDKHTKKKGNQINQKVNK